MKKSDKFIPAPDRYSNPKTLPDTVICAQDLEANGLYSFYPERPAAANRCYRYKLVSSGIYLVERWDTYSVARPGRWGKARSQLTLRYHVKDDGKKRGKYVFTLTGELESFYWSGASNCTVEFAPGSGGSTEEYGESLAIVRRVQLNDAGQLLKYVDASRGRKNIRLVEYIYPEGKRVLARRRNKFGDYKLRNYNGTLAYETRRREDNKAYEQEGDFIEREYDDGNLICETRYVAGQRHGITKSFNRYGRCIDIGYYFNDSAIPNWMWQNASDLSPNEILECEEQVRRGVVELQGPGTFIARCEEAGMIKPGGNEKEVLEKLLTMEFKIK